MQIHGASGYCCRIISTRKHPALFTSWHSILTDKEAYAGAIMFTIAFELCMHFIVRLNICSSVSQAKKLRFMYE